MSKPDDKIALRVVGLTYSQNQQGAYALILGQADGPVRIPVVIGPAEAQSIAMMIEGINVPRPLTHDLMASIIRSFDIVVKEVFIYKFEDGIFSSEVTLHDGVRQVTIDCRTSDAVALAMRMRCRIFTTRAVMEETGFVIDDEEGAQGVTEAGSEAAEAPQSEEQLPLAELTRRMRRAIGDELYEEAGRLSAIIKRRIADGETPPTEDEIGGDGDSLPI